MVLPAIERHGPIDAWIIDDTGFPKQGRHSVGVARQYCGQLGKQDNCQVAVSLSIANHHASLPVAYQLYLPKERARMLLDAFAVGSAVNGHKLKRRPGVGAQAASESAGILYESLGSPLVSDSKRCPRWNGIARP